MTTETHKGVEPGCAHDEEEAVLRVAIVTSWLQTPYWETVLGSCLSALKHLGACPVVYCWGYADRGRVSGQSPFFQLAAAAPDDALILFAPSSIDSGMGSFLAAAGSKPVVTVGQKLAGIAGVWMHNAAGVRQIMDHLHLRCRYERIAFIRGPRENGEAEARYHAFADYCAVHSLKEGLNLVEQGDFTEESGRAAAARLLERHQQLPEAIFASNDRMALGVLSELRTRGVSVPEQVALVGFDDLEARAAQPALTTVRQPLVEMGQAAAHKAVGAARGEPVEEASLFSPELVCRESCRPAGHGGSEPPSPTLSSIRPGAQQVALESRPELEPCLQSLRSLEGAALFDSDELAPALFDAQRAMKSPLRFARLLGDHEKMLVLFGPHAGGEVHQDELIRGAASSDEPRWVMPVHRGGELVGLLVTEGRQAPLESLEQLSLALGR